MKVLIACEESQIVTEAFIKRGHDAISCDLLPGAKGLPYHQGPLEDFIGGGEEWDMIIAFPPCTHLAVSGARYFEQKKKDGRQEYAMSFFMMIASRNCLKIAIENPVGIMNTWYRKPDQIIQPYEFGENASKKTCLWLKGLPALKGASYIEPRIINGKKRWSNQCDSGQNKLGPSEERAKIRSRTFPGIAQAMADQWG